MLKLKNNEIGITLVALVITIIILLILAGISIVTLTGSGLFENARLAEQESKNKQEEEQGTLGDYENKISEMIGNRELQNINITPESIQFANFYGNNTANRSISLTLNKGKYLIFLSRAFAYKSSTSVTSSSPSASTQILLSQSENSEITELRSDRRIQSATTKSADVYTITDHETRVFFIDVKDTSDIITNNYSSQNQNTVPLDCNMYSIKID